MVVAVQFWQTMPAPRPQPEISRPFSQTTLPTIVPRRLISYEMPTRV
jgi:hypothetical protein